MQLLKHVDEQLNCKPKATWMQVRDTAELSKRSGMGNACKCALPKLEIRGTSPPNCGVSLQPQIRPMTRHQTPPTHTQSRK
mmetsp:Transcript_91161/g.221361  ORF Transcript_91161/g.221361 Transcript_91161/m.221361 type:complete len:81 (-) Transcript_91161:378-620(-)